MSGRFLGRHDDYSQVNVQLVFYWESSSWQVNITLHHHADGVTTQRRHERHELLAGASANDAYEWTDEALRSILTEHGVPWPYEAFSEPFDSPGAAPAS